MPKLNPSREVNRWTEKKNQRKYFHMLSRVRIVQKLKPLHNSYILCILLEIVRDRQKGHSISLFDFSFTFRNVIPKFKYEMNLYIHTLTTDILYLNILIRGSSMIRWWCWAVANGIKDSEIFLLFTHSCSAFYIISCRMEKW